MKTALNVVKGSAAAAVAVAVAVEEEVSVLLLLLLLLFAEGGPPGKLTRQDGAGRRVSKLLI
jgi:hypothetical protein